MNTLRTSEKYVFFIMKVCMGKLDGKEVREAGRHADDGVGPRESIVLLMFNVRAHHLRAD